MTSYWWCCKTCGHEFYDSRDVLEHRQDTGHNGAGLVSTDVPLAPDGTSDAAREEAMAVIRDAIRSAKVKGGRL